jgi:hypothetical protein
MQLENSVPQNSIELYYPPAASSIAYPISGVAKRNGIAAKPKLECMSRRLAANAQTPDRFGVVRNSRGNYAKRLRLETSIMYSSTCRIWRSKLHRKLHRREREKAGSP